MKNRIFIMNRPHDALAKQVICLATKVHRTLGCGFADSVYRNALSVELRNAHIAFEHYPTVSVMYAETEVGFFQADLIIEDRLIIDLKTVEALEAKHSIHLSNYLAATKIELGLLLNFGSPSFEFFEARATGAKIKLRTRAANPEPPELHS